MDVDEQNAESLVGQKGIIGNSNMAALPGMEETAASHAFELANSVAKTAVAPITPLAYNSPDLKSPIGFLS